MRASSATIVRSQKQQSWLAPARQYPWTAATTGLGRSQICRKRSMFPARCAWLSVVSRRVSCSIVEPGAGLMS